MKCFITTRFKTTKKSQSCDTLNIMVGDVVLEVNKVFVSPSTIDKVNKELVIDLVSSE